MIKEAERHVQAVAAALEVLSAFDHDVPLRLKDLYERTGQNRSRLLRLMGTLEAHGFIEHDAAAGTYALGRKLYAIGWMLHDRFSRISDTVRPALKRLVAISGDTAFFSSVEGNKRLVVAAEESTEALRFTAREGQTRPLYLGASSRVLLAYADPAVLERVVDAAVAAKVELDVPKLRADLETIRDVGHAVSRGEVTAHGFAVAVPVLRAGPHGCDVLTLAGPLAKLGPEMITRYVEQLRHEAALLGPALAQHPAAQPSGIPTEFA